MIPFSIILLFIIRVPGKSDTTKLSGCIILEMNDARNCSPFPLVHWFYYTMISGLTYR